MSNFFNRDQSWLKFNERVLAQASDSSLPVLERVRFLSIFSSNLDEFFMKRVGYLKRVSARDIPFVGLDQLPPTKILKDLKVEVTQLLNKRSKVYDSLVLELSKNNISFLKWSDLTEEEKAGASKYFRDKVFPILTPLAVDKAHPFPFLSNLSLSLGIILSQPKSTETLFARIKIPPTLPQWLQLPSQEINSYRLLPLLNIIENNLGELFPEMNIKSIMPFRVTRSADIEETSDDVDDRLDLVEEELRLRRVARIVRFEHSKIEDRSMLKFLFEELEISEDDVYEVPGELTYAPLQEVASLNIPKLRFKPHTPIKPKAFSENESVFQVLKKTDVLVHHPFESFNESVEKFLKEAVKDPQVLAIKMTLYRAGENSPIIPLLIKAAEQGKQVVAVIELKARFDEARNIYWSEMLEDAGVHVVYGVVGKKIHSKNILVIRQEDQDYRFYSHIGTGNYNPTTAKLYTDFGIFTSDRKIGDELIEVFNFLTGLSLKRNYQKLLVAPVNMRKRFIQYIKKEIEVAKSGGKTRIIAKMNSLEDQELCDYLYQASQAGVKVDLIVRGFCVLKPKVEGLSDNIRVVSVIGRLLEHSRVFYFQKGAEDPLDGSFYIGSADWMYRNLNNRIEVVVPVQAKAHRELMYNILNRYIDDTVTGWELNSDGSYAKRKSQSGDKSVQDQLFEANLSS